MEKIKKSLKSVTLIKVQNIIMLVVIILYLLAYICFWGINAYDFKSDVVWSVFLYRIQEIFLVLGMGLFFAVSSFTFFDEKKPLYSSGIAMFLAYIQKIYLLNLGKKDTFLFTIKIPYISFEHKEIVNVKNILLDLKGYVSSYEVDSAGEFCENLVNTVKIIDSILSIFIWFSVFTIVQILIMKLYDVIKKNKKDKNNVNKRQRFLVKYIIVIDYIFSIGIIAILFISVDINSCNDMINFIKVLVLPFYILLTMFETKMIKSGKYGIATCTGILAIMSIMSVMYYYYY